MADAHPTPAREIISVYRDDWEAGARNARAHLDHIEELRELIQEIHQRYNPGGGPLDIAAALAARADPTHQQSLQVGAGMAFSKEWCMKMAELEGDSEIGAGPVAYDPEPELAECPHGDGNACEQYRLQGQRCQNCPLVGMGGG